jgi:DNA polymerase I-like protein with 3'-5' exonuclease and polymerase domains
MAFLPQSTSSDICLRAMTKVSKEIADTDAYIRNIVHDSILIDCRANEAEDISKILNSRMIESAYQVVGDYVKFATDVKIGSHWGEV